MQRLAVVGGGFAGVWAALAAARVLGDHSGEVEISIVTPNDDLVIRPRLYQAQPERMRVPLVDLLGPHGIAHRRARVTRIDVAGRSLRTADGQALGWDRLVVASGSRMRPPRISGAELVHDVDTLDAARALQEHLDRLPMQGGSRPGLLTAVVVGSGFTGLEVATELVGRLRALAAAHGLRQQPRVVLVERHHQVAASLGPGPHAAIARALADAGVEVRTGETVEAFDGSVVTFSSGSTLAAGTVVWTAGMTASPLTEQLPGDKDGLGRAVVDRYLRLHEDPAVYVAGDTAAARADGDHWVTQSCQFAIPLGKTAGWNAALDLVGRPSERRPFQPAPYVTCLDLGAGGAVFTTGWGRAVQLEGSEAKEVKASINELIRPPAGDPAALLEQADPRWAPGDLTLA